MPHNCVKKVDKLSTRLGKTCDQLSTFFIHSHKTNHPSWVKTRLFPILIPFLTHAFNQLILPVSICCSHIYPQYPHSLLLNKLFKERLI